MFDIITNVKNRNIVTSISIEDLVEEIKNPSSMTKKIITEARELGKSNPLYSEVKKGLPCFVPNYTHEKYVKASTALKPTGFLYIDIDDEIELDYSKFSFIACAWKSLSGIGKGILVSVSNMPIAGCSKQDIEFVTEFVSAKIGIQFDREAVSRDRLNVISYDEGVYYNPNFNSINIEYTEELKNNHSIVKKKNNNSAIRLQVNDNFFSSNLRVSNFEEIVSEFVFEDDEVFKDLSSNKIKYTEIFIPKVIKDGNRNAKLYKIVSGIYGLNPNACHNDIYSYMLKINSSVCETPLETKEVLDICTKVLSKEPILFSNKEKSYIFNADYMLTGTEKRSISVTETNKKRAIHSTDSILEVINQWDIKENGKITYDKISQKTGLGKATVSRRAKEIKELMKNVNLNLVNSI